MHTNGEALLLIRKGTNRLHVRLDKGTVMSSLASSLCDIKNYKLAMCGLAIAYQHADRALLIARGHCPAELESYQPRFPFILSDLSAMQLVRPHILLADLPVPTSYASYLGMRYVVEGAQLGSRVIERNLTQSVIASALPNAKQFWSRQFGSTHCWPALLSLLNNLHERNELAQAVRAARCTFRHFLNCFYLIEEQ